MPCCDWMHSAALTGNPKAKMRMSKPPRSWLGTPAEQEFDLDALHEPTIIFSGVARTAASKYPKNSNVAAMLAFATAGLDATEVELVADPTDDSVRIWVDFASDGGKISYEMQGVPSPENPRTGSDVPYSVVKAIKNLASPVSIGT